MPVKKFDDYPEFRPHYTPEEMFSKGILMGDYFKDNLGLTPVSRLGLPKQFLSKVDKSKLASTEPSPDKNAYKIKASQPYEYWKKMGWIYPADPYGWINWYIQFYYGRRDKSDKTQIGRWKSFKARHGGMHKKYPDSDKIKQALLHWAIDHKRV